MKMVTFGSSLTSFYCCFFSFLKKFLREKESPKRTKSYHVDGGNQVNCFFLSSVFFFHFGRKLEQMTANEGFKFSDSKE